MKLHKKVNQQLISEYCKEFLPKWRKEISNEIVGVHFGKKYKKDRRTNRFSIVFHVDKKILNPEVNIPKTIEIRTATGVLRVSTDVIETGRTKLASIMCGDKARSATDASDIGAIGLFFKKNNIWYVCSNMHVLAPQRLSQRTFYAPISLQQPDVICFNQFETHTAFLEKASFNGTDLAIARIQDQGVVNNNIKNIGPPNGTINSTNLNYGDSIKAFGAFSNQLLNGNIENVKVARIVEYMGIDAQINDLIQTRLPARLGDSGSPVVSQWNKIIGIIASIDNVFCYVIPSEDILSFVKPDIN